MIQFEPPWYLFQSLDSTTISASVESITSMNLTTRPITRRRRSASLHRNFTRPLDQVVVVYEAGGELMMVTKNLDAGQPATHRLGGAYAKRHGALLMTGLDADLDGREKVAILATDSSDEAGDRTGWAVEIFQVEETGIRSLGLHPLGGLGQAGEEALIRVGFTATRKVILQNAPRGRREHHGGKPRLRRNSVGVSCSRLANTEVK